MGMAQGIGAGIGALAGGFGAQKQAKASNKPKEFKTDQTTTQTPYGAALPLIDVLGPGILERFSNPVNLPRFRSGVGTNASRSALADLKDFQGNPELLNFINSTMSGGTNQYGDALASRLLADNSSRSNDLIEQFLRTGLTGGAYGGGGGAGGGGGTGGGFSFDSISPSAALPDTLAGGTRFAEELRKILSDERLDPANDPTMQPLLDTLNSQAARGFEQILAPLESRAAGIGRSGGSFHRDLVDQAAADSGGRLSETLAQALFGERQNAMDRMLQALGLAGNRDIAAGQIAQSDRSSARSTAAGSAANQAALDLQRELGLRGQDLSAILGLQGSENNRLGLLGGLSSNLDATRLGAGQLGLGLDQLNLNSLLGAGDIASGIDSRALAGEQGRYQSDLMRALQPETDLDSLLRRTLAIAGLGGTQTLSGVNVQPGAGIDPTAALLMGLLGGASTGAGIGGMLGGGGGGGGGGLFGPNGLGSGMV